MYSKLIPFENIVDSVSDATGIQNLRNHYPKIRRFIHRSTKDIGFGGSLILKRILYQTSDGTIVEDSNGKQRFRLPSDLVRIEEVGMCQDGICPEDYNIQGNYGFLCREVDSFHLIYYALLCDGSGNPAVSENHEEAVIAGILWRMYQPKVWNREGDRATYLDLGREYEDRCAEARGMDAFPTTAKEWAEIGQKLRMSYRDVLIYDSDEQCYCCLPLSYNNEVIDSLIDNTDDMVYYWQYTDLSKDITDAPNIDQTFLDAQGNQPVQVFIDGFIIPYTAVGRIGIAITNVDQDYYQIIDIFETDITSVAFDTYYDATNRIQIYISKEIYSHGNIYYKLIKN